MTKTCVILGASHAGGQMAVSLRQSGWDGDILLIGEENYLPYHRPPLSKDFLLGGKDLSEILIRPQHTYEDGNIETVLNHRVLHIDREDKVVFLGGDHVIAYDKLVIATGARPRELRIPGADTDIPGVFYLRHADDVLAIKANVAAGKKAVIIGGGYIGLETAASLTKQGMKVTVLEMADRVLERVTAPVMSDFYKRVHREEGVTIVENCAATHIMAGQGKVTAIADNGESYEGNMLIIGIGVIPNQELADECGLEAGNGIVVNEFMQTSDPDIYAIGDVTWHHNPIYDRHIRLESVPNATDQAKIAALSLCGKPKPYNALPWFWSDQFDLKLQIAGLSTGYDDVVLRGDPKRGRSFAAFYFKDDTLIAVDAVNRPQEYMIGRRIIPLCIAGTKVIDKKALADEQTSLKTLL